MKTEKEIDDLIARAVAANLSGTDFLVEFDYDTIRDQYNGIGPEFIPVSLRAKITKYLDLFAPAALIHDLRYYKADGTQLAWQQANEEFRLNCRRLADLRYPWWHPRRYIARNVADLLADCTTTPAGLAAYISACRKAALAIASLAMLCAGCLGTPRAKDFSVKGMYANAASETVAIGSARITLLPESIESFVAHYSEDTAWLQPSIKTHSLDIYLTGTNATASASNIVSSICTAFQAVKPPKTTETKEN